MLSKEGKVENWIKHRGEKNANSKLRILLNILFFLKHRVSYFSVLYSKTSMYFLKGVCSVCSVASWYSREYRGKKAMWRKQCTKTQKGNADQGLWAGPAGRGRSGEEDLAHGSCSMHSQLTVSASESALFQNLHYTQSQQESKVSTNYLIWLYFKHD